MYCRNCGSKLDENAYVCVNCGVLVDSNINNSIPSRVYREKKKVIVMPRVYLVSFFLH